jgi:phospholipase C
LNKLIPLTLAAFGLATPASAQISAFQHVILVIQENRTPDNLFHGLCDVSQCGIHPGPGQYDIQTAGWLDKTSPTGVTDPHSIPLAISYDLNHKHSGFVNQCDIDASGACAMDGYAGCSTGSSCPPHASYAYVASAHVQPYLGLARSYGWANYMFQTNQGPSYPAHQFLFGATSAPTLEDDHKGIFAAENLTAPVGCIAPSTARVLLINPQGVEYPGGYPCFKHLTLADLLHARGVSWRYYAQGNAFPDSIWVAPNSIKHICNSTRYGGRCTGDKWSRHLVFTPSQVLSDISTNCNLAGVSWVIPDGADSDHASLKGSGGPSWVASIVNAVGTSPCLNLDGSSYWNSTAIIITWDDWGGWYDHEPPMIEAAPQGGYQMGFRVPLIVVSAYTPAETISNLHEDFGSVIRFVEGNFGITEGALTFADMRGTGDLTEFFALSRAPRAFRAIHTPLSARYFLTRKSPPTPPDDD